MGWLCGGEERDSGSDQVVVCHSACLRPPGCSASPPGKGDRERCHTVCICVCVCVPSSCLAVYVPGRKARRGVGR